MSTESFEGRAGDFARRRFATRRRRWRRRFWWAFPIVAVIPIAIALPIALLMHAAHQGFWIGFALGAGAGAAMVIFDSPPAHIERWRIGSDGEKATACQVRRLVNEGWELYNDIATEHGNIDHVLVGPPGVFMLESKRLAGEVKFQTGTLVVRWHEDPHDGYENDSIAERARGAAATLHHELKRAGIHTWVQGIVVLWADFDQRSIEQDKLAWGQGDQLASVLRARPVRYSGESLDQRLVATRNAVHRLRQDRRAPPADDT